MLKCFCASLTMGVVVGFVACASENETEVLYDIPTRSTAPSLGGAPGAPSGAGGSLPVEGVGSAVVLPAEASGGGGNEGVPAQAGGTGGGAGAGADVPTTDGSAAPTGGSGGAPVDGATDPAATDPGLPAAPTADPSEYVDFEFTPSPATTQTSTTPTTRPGRTFNIAGQPATP